MNEIFFLNNTKALFQVDEILAYKLKSLKKPYTMKVVNEENVANFKDDNGHILYNNAKAELNEHLNLFNTTYKKYPVLFFYGFGNGALIKQLCKNEKHKHIVVFEDNLEILALAFHLNDFSKELSSEKLILFYTPNITTAQLSTLFTYNEIQKSVKIYNLFIHSDFYIQFYQNEIQKLNLKLVDIIRFIVRNHGNDPMDSLTGIVHTLQNIPKMLTHTPFKELLKKRTSKLKNAAIVATGPSLIKQLPLLKEYQNKVAIFCADSSYPILYKHNIKPDYVFSLERVSLSSEFFNNDFGEFDKDIIFILASLVHENTIKYLEKNNRKYMLVQRPLQSSLTLKLDDFGYLGVGGSVANMAFELIALLKFENVFLIGQDLAYANDGSSHPKEHIYGTQGDEIRGHLYTNAYGGVGQVRTQITWEGFRKTFERDIFFARTKLGLSTYNCTEGGARIEGCKELPFKNACEQFLTQDLQKPFEFVGSFNEEKIKKIAQRMKKLIKKNLLESKNYIIKVNKELDKLEPELRQENPNYSNLNKIKDKLLSYFKDFKKLKLFNELTKSLHFHNEANIVKFEVLNDEEQTQYLINFLLSQRHWFLQGLSYLQKQNEVIEKTLKIWESNDFV
ncbi:motility associated factor glycosyltransferase family protein [Campylobacter sp. LR264d]|uniref:motility associated factor glycosyltransferase family protein n=1 Tax=Campylobacter sp. LR264d TaxID=2593544 RepID=UPI00123B0669|nr:motility associated factor glycosyltransferase family protein [Campylobacter sp. LR264d]KAA6231055.1 motility associated factor glycosyltransferase family protein [Campylobacter sp. LR264d]